MAHYLASWPVAYALSELRIYFSTFMPIIAAVLGKVVGHKNDRICVALILWPNSGQAHGQIIGPFCLFLPIFAAVQNKCGSRYHAIS